MTVYHFVTKGWFPPLRMQHIQHNVQRMQRNVLRVQCIGTCSIFLATSVLDHALCALLEILCKQVSSHCIAYIKAYTSFLVLRWMRTGGNWALSTCRLRFCDRKWLCYFHWLPVHYQIQFKIDTLTTCQPSYLHNLFQLHQPSRALSSSTQQLLQVPYMSTDFGRRALGFSSPATWNSIPTSIKNCSSLYSFKRHLSLIS